MKLAALILFLASVTVVAADDWTTADGTTYKDVKVLSHDAGYVTILDSDGGGKVPLRLLTPDLQRQFGYDAAKAAACEAATVAQDKADRQALVKEQEAEYEAQQKKEAAALEQPATQVATTQTAPAAPAPAIEAAAQPDQGKLSADDRAAIQQKITDLQNDIAFMQREEAKVGAGGHGDAGYQNGNHYYGGGGYADKIKEEQQQVQDLQQQLNGN